LKGAAHDYAKDNKLVEAIQNVARRRKKFIASLVEGSIINEKKNRPQDS
jgi:hypothetical protein